MSGTPTKTGSRVAALVVLVVLLGIGYAISPLFLPRWRWSNIEPYWETLAQQAKVPVSKLQQTYDVVVRYKPRGDNDPVPWQVVSSEPLYDPENDDEHYIVRVTLVSDRSGEPPSKLRLGSLNYRDIFFKGKVWRFAPGSFGFNRHRPVLVYDAWTFDKLESGDAYRWDGEMKESSKWTNDDEDVEDGYTPGGAPAAE